MGQQACSTAWAHGGCLSREETHSLLRRRYKPSGSPAADKNPALVPSPLMPPSDTSLVGAQPQPEPSSGVHPHSAPSICFREHQDNPLKNPPTPPVSTTTANQKTYRLPQDKLPGGLLKGKALFLPSVIDKRVGGCEFYCLPPPIFCLRWQDGPPAISSEPFTWIRKPP